MAISVTDTKVRLVLDTAADSPQTFSFIADTATSDKLLDLSNYIGNMLEQYPDFVYKRVDYTLEESA
jgi:hypothetical protein